MKEMEAAMTIGTLDLEDVDLVRPFADEFVRSHPALSFRIDYGVHSGRG